MTKSVSTEPDTPQLEASLTDPTQIAASLPYLLGFHPQESLVFLWLKSNTLIVAQRADLCPGLPSDEYAESFCGPGSNIPADSVLGICVSRQTRGWVPLWRHLDSVCPVPIRARLHVSGSKVAPVAPDGRLSKPWRWIGVRERDAASRDFPDRRPQRGRDRLKDEVEYDPSRAIGDECLVDEPTRIRNRPNQSNLGQLASMLARQPLMCSPRLLADAAREHQGRDLVLWCAARMGVADCRSLLDGLLEALRGTRVGAGAHLAAAASVVAWLCGDGARANAAVERCLTEDPGNRMGALIDQTIAHAIPPAQVREMFVDTPLSVLGLAEGLLDEDFTRRYSPA